MSSDIIIDFDNILELYEYNKDCYKIIRNIQEINEHKLFDNTKFIDSDKVEIEILLEKTQKEADDYYMLYLWVTFERFIINFLSIKGEKLIDDKPELFADNFYCKFKENIERWRFDDVLDLFDEVLDKSLIDNVKKIKRYRDWIGHRNKKKKKPIAFNPYEVYNILIAMVKEIQQEAMLGVAPPNPARH
ncbi:MAG: hypothetical protein HQK91_04265 [Nitrospirae bacterium]|nr:hypothetical protein [Nitrospirota bacterium]MBF0540648.1 hypothetical protein [Nitrospirota bacterium]